MPAEPEPAGASSRLDPEPTPSRLGPPTAGGLIRDAREAQGIDLASLAAMLKIPLRRLEALEMGRHEELQGPTFERALAQAACRVLKIDPKPVLALLPQHERNTLERVSEGINTPFRDGQGSGGFELPAGMRPVIIFVGILILATLALLFVPGSWIARAKAEFAGGAAASAPAESASVPAVAVPVEMPAASAVAPAAAATLAPVLSAPAPAAASAASSVSPTPAAASATAAQGVDEVLAHVAGTPSIPLQVIATADSWVEVVDAQGHTLLSRVVVAGESVGLDGALPMRVKIGNARGTHLKLRGDNVDLTPWTRDNVARLELK
ncbi:helix-turn-helix domain-containing protein [Scleromatobacter humisilvae]|uniref:Helix-turn-helix domain-containing protein n=1 Tax=Scleromatobacter humisilvae TaxID=2897159 RepID=A0A9X1YJM2_9BURK|nr:helix-turn-helix domain-containing protein [Scleromatobacter humisilvae]MCK9686610.1 helix-turn-helix domain-containing protein [Scleromatobacter humisilvae]